MSDSKPLYTGTFSEQELVEVADYEGDRSGFETGGDIYKRGFWIDGIWQNHCILLCSSELWDIGKIQTPYI